MIPISGTVRSAVNLKAAESKWASRKKTNPLSRQEINKRQEWTQEDWMKNRFETEREQDREQSKMQSILNKIMNQRPMNSIICEERILRVMNPTRIPFGKRKHMRRNLNTARRRTMSIR